MIAFVSLRPTKEPTMSNPDSVYAPTIGAFLSKVLADHMARNNGQASGIASLHFELGAGLHEDGLLWYPADSVGDARRAVIHSVSTLAFDVAVTRRIPALRDWIRPPEHIMYPDAASRSLFMPKWFHLIHIDLALMPKGADLRDALRQAGKEKPLKIRVKLR